MARTVRQLVVRARWPLLAAVLAFAAALTLAPDEPLTSAISVGAKAAVAVGLLTVALRVGRTMHAGPRSRASAGVREPLGALALIAVAIAALFWRTPSRLTLNLCGFLALGIPLAWVVTRRAGGRPAALAVAALGVVALGTVAVDARRAPIIEDAYAASTVKWTVGWPNERWALRHVILLDGPLPTRAASLAVPLARDYRGDAQVLVSLNGRDLGAIAPRGTGFRVPVPVEPLQGQRRLVFELRVDRLDRDLRLMAFRYGRGATLPNAASEFFDSQRWWPGTFNDATGAPQPGIYVLRLEFP